jgi:ribosomal protein S18 acetylase RimI-like enzyme
MDELESGALETDAIAVRALAETDLDDIVRIDQHLMGRPRREYYRDKIGAALRNSRLHMSLVAELDGMTVGFLMASMHYGEFGQVEPTAVLEAIGVHPEFRSRHIGSALMRQFLMNGKALGVERVRTEVEWSDTRLLEFLHRKGFSPAGRIVLERIT